MVTLTLPEDARGRGPTDSRTTISVLWNAFKTALRKRGFMGDYVAVVEAHHSSGYAHLHVAVNLEALAVAEGYTGGENRAADAAALGATQAFLSESWGRLGGGFVDYHRGLRGHDASEAARYLSKYLGKSQATRAPWDETRYCTEDSSFRARPWHRYFCSWGASAIMAKVRAGHGDPDPDYYPGRPREASGWILARPELRISGRIVASPWNPAQGSAIVASCGGHPPIPEWVPGDCHHGGGPRVLGQCLCVPPWAFEPAWTEPLVDLLAMDRGRTTGPGAWHQNAVDWAIERWDAPPPLDWWDLQALGGSSEREADENSALESFFDELLFLEPQELADILTGKVSRTFKSCNRVEETLKQATEDESPDMKSWRWS